jgi:adenylate kinase family enzyme
MRRVIVIGCGSARKSTLARRLAVRLQLPRAVCLRRALLRMVRNHGRIRPGLPLGCPERLDVEFVRYIWDFPHTHRQRIVTAIERFGRHLRVVGLRGDRDADDFLATAGVT